MAEGEDGASGGGAAAEALDDARKQFAVARGLYLTAAERGALGRL
ncbi:MAG: hypothetical protein WDM91_14315 [Rhizomicrobium sp.]